MTSIHEKLTDQGYLVEQIIPNDELSKGLVNIALENAGGKYSSIKIHPTVDAITGWREGRELIPVTPSHLVYVLYNSEHPEVKKMIEKCESGPLMTMPTLHLEDGGILDLKGSYQENILRLTLSDVCKNLIP